MIAPEFRQQTYYEWVAEPLTVDGDVIDPLFSESWADVHRMGLQFESPDCHVVQYALVKNVGNDADGLQDRSYAYLDNDGNLPATFENGDAVPKRFLNRSYT